MTQFKKYLEPIPLAILLASLIISFHYVWMNKYAIIPYADGESFTVLNTWTGKIYTHPVTLESHDELFDNGAIFLTCDKFPINSGRVELP